jgi:hypothetical protein
MASFMSFSSHQDIIEFVTKYQMIAHDIQYVRGPEIIEIKNLKNNDDLYILSELPLAHVHTISFRDCNFHQPSQTKIFKRHGFFMNVLHWEFFGCTLSKEILKTFFINKSTRPVRSIIVEPKDNGLEIFRILIKWKKLHHIARFAFIGSAIGKEDLENLLLSPMFSHLEFLDLSHTKFYDEGLSDFVTKFNNKKIKGLYLQNTGISETLAKTIMTNKAFSNLEILDLSNNFCMNIVVQMLADSKHINKIQELYLRNTFLTMPALEDLISSHNFASMRKLDVSNNFSLKDDLALALLFKPFVRKLEHLNLENTDLSSVSICAMVLNHEVGHLKNLKELDVSNNPRLNVSQIFNMVSSHPQLMFDEVFKARSFSEDLKEKFEQEYKVKESPFIRSLKVLHMANVGLDQDLKEKLERKYRLKVDTDPYICKDYSDFLQHVNIPLESTQQTI